MGIISKHRKSATKVLGSGIEVNFSSLLGVHQSWITRQNEEKRMQGFIDLMVDCINSIGDDKHIDEKKIERLLAADRRQLLVEIRQLSTDYNTDFSFDYEFPASTGQKRVQKYTIVFDEKDFPLRPYMWVREKMIFDYIKKNGLIKDDLKR